jgi:predicted deacetylase
MKRLVVSIHDVHPASFDAARGQIEFCESLGVRRFSILVVPDFHMIAPFEASPDLVEWLRFREKLGDEIVLHGLYHFNDKRAVSPRFWFWNRLYTASEAEFLHLDFHTAHFRIRYGKQRLKKAGLHPVGFVAPAWLMNSQVRKAVFNVGMMYTNTVNSIVAASGKTIFSRSLCYSARAGWRQVGSLGWNSALWQVKRHHNIVRLSLHPRDLEVRSFRSHISAIISAAMALNFESTTYSEVVADETAQNV